jgi:hypothetical protein
MLSVNCSIPTSDEYGFPIDKDGLQLCLNKRVGLAHNLMYALADSFEGRKSIKDKQEILDRITERVFDSDRVQWELKINKRSTLPLIIETLNSFQKAKAEFGVQGKEDKDIEEIKYYFEEAKHWINEYLKDELAYQYP